jgi:hypothetical protein
VLTCVKISVISELLPTLGGVSCAAKILTTRTEKYLIIFNFFSLVIKKNTATNQVYIYTGENYSLLAFILLPLARRLDSKGFFCVLS